MKTIDYKATLIVCILGFVIPCSLLAQERFTAESYLANPEKNDGKKVTVNVAWVDVPAVYANDDSGYRDFLVVTCAQQQMQSSTTYSTRGEIIVRIPTGEAEAFIKRHGTTAQKMWYGNNGGNRVKQVTGIFRKMKSVYGGYLDTTDGKASDCEPRVSWLNGRYVRNPNANEPVPVGQTKAER